VQDFIFKKPMVFTVFLSLLLVLAVIFPDVSAIASDSGDKPEMESGAFSGAAEPEDDGKEEKGEKPIEADIEEVEKEKEYLNGAQRYARWVKYMEHMAMTELDLWGSTTTIPQGFALGLFGWGTMRPGGRYDEHRKLTELLPILDVPDPFNVGGSFFKFDFDVDGSAKGYFAGLQYGVTDRLMIGINTMWTVLHIKMDPVFEPGSCERLGVATREEFYTLLELLGRPRPKHQYDSDFVDWGDTTLSLTWNYFRNDWFSSGLTGNLFIPTAHRADPDSALIFGLGPDIDSGNAAWGLGLVKMFDFRPPGVLKAVTFSFAGEGAYFFQTRRKSPNFLKPNQDVWDYMTAQGVELDFLPDLSDMDKYYYYTPPPFVAASAGIGAGPISVSYRHGWGFEAKFDSNSPGFQKMLDELGLVGTGDDGKVIFAASLPLTPIYLPAIIQFRTEYVTDGKNNIVFRDIYQLGLGFVVPINPPEKYKVPKGWKWEGYNFGEGGDK